VKKKSTKHDVFKKTFAPFVRFIRFPIMSSEELSGKVVPANVLSSDQILDLFAYVSGDRKSKLGPHITLFVSKPREGPSFGGNRWNVDDRPDNRLQVSTDGLTLSGPLSSVNANLGIRAKHGYNRGKIYWEVKIVQYNNSGNGYNTAGICLKTAPLTASHGYPLANSTGSAWMVDLYCLSRISGTSHQQSPYGRSGTALKSGDVVGFLLDLTGNGTLAVYLNGTCVGIPYSDLKDHGSLFYPVMGIGRFDRPVYETNFKARIPK